ncbi:MAG: hypothetical protein ABUL50_13725, partial [Rhizobacter sp.]
MTTLSLIKLLLLFVHLLGTSMALGSIVATDIRLLARLADARVRIPPPNEFVMRLITISLAVLYVTGGAMILLGLRDDPNYLANPKLLAKLVLVLILTVNAFVLHRYTFPSLARAGRVARWKFNHFLRVAMPVSISNCLWMYCAFLGIARPWSFTVSMTLVFAVGATLWLITLALIVGVLMLAAQDRTDCEPGWIDRLKRR